MFDKGYLIGGRYKILALLGEGGMANVYLAEDIILKRKVAVKILRLDLQKDPKTVERFKREARATSELSHPNIVSILDVGIDHNRQYIVMEYVDGPDLEQYIQKNNPIPLQKVIRIMDQILAAMTLAHKHHVIHRDLKPQNILMDKNGNIKIVDFGIAVALNQSTMSQTNTAIGSVHYMSPEQARGSRATMQSDIYSLGIILYELLMGQVPFGGENAVAVALKHFQETTPSLRKQNPQIPQALENVVFKATAKDPRDRYQSVMQMKQDLDSSLDPSRQNEAVFKPKFDPNEDNTIVLPQMEGSVQDTQQAPDKTNESPQTPTLWENIKKHKWWWLGAGIAFIGIMVILIFALGRKDDITIPSVNNLSESEARQTLLARGLKVGKTRYQYSNSVKKGRIITTDPQSGLTVKNGQIVDLIVSRGAKLKTVPNVVGESYTTARRKLTKVGFKVEKVTQQDSQAPKNSVIAQDIPPGRKVDANKTTITLYVSRGKASSSKDEVRLRDLTGYTLKGAQDYAKDNGLNLDITEEKSASAQKDTVIRQDPAPDTRVKKGSRIHLVISSGNSDDDRKNDDSSDNTEVTKAFTVPYQASGTNDQGNHVQIYISDADHSLSNIYRDQVITQNETFTIPFNLSKGNGHIRIERDGNTILDEEINK
ncbi:Stk1 family PASTA domain-containing Ser/Thr kinase [Lactobacillus sp. PV034]|uniref:Stk1 family PASTA domain-containing Ser/Thr kinase n=1 Tax=Lactobacillus sp. PV034 TaxID=2594495 RepID=UPI00223F154D|nr:Stk1 family PASTA domain-containing Ser/Thr kinase [Lactobacillus sp. PV034]QNQ80272.1 Stk1 family PASTA domain-containing Ser/Thr kinase [Lactobacillus sp. PV034]